VVRLLSIVLIFCAASTPIDAEQRRTDGAALALPGSTSKLRSYLLW
jgi:hypothetical protein